MDGRVKYRNGRHYPVSAPPYPFLARDPTFAAQTHHVSVEPVPRERKQQSVDDGTSHFGRPLTRNSRGMISGLQIRKLQKKLFSTFRPAESTRARS